jgi:hypothetical protein
VRNGGKVSSRWQRNEKKKKKICKGKREEFTVVVLPLVRVWVGGDNGVQADGEFGGGRRSQRREKEERELVAEKTGEGN